MSVTRLDFATELSTEMGWPVVQSNLEVLLAWMAAENTGAAFNPLATEEPWTGSTDFNSAGVKDYLTLAAGIAATLTTLRNGDYPRILEGFSRVTRPDVLAEIVAHSKWGTGNLVYEVLVNVQSDYQTYADKILGGGANATPAPTPTPTPAPTQVAGGFTIQPGDNLWELAHRFNTTPQAIYDANAAVLDAAARDHGLANSSNGWDIYPGTVITIP
jgi:LysM repeat protein